MRGLLLALLALLLLPAAAAAEDAAEQADPGDLLREALSSPPSYEGVRSVVTWSTEGEASAVEIHEAREGAEVRMEFQPTPNAGVRVMMASPDAWRIQQPDRSWTEVFTTCARLAEQRLSQAMQSYSWQVLGEEVVAGRPAVVLAAEPTYNGGLRHRFWVDQVHPVVLRRVKFTPDGQMIYASTFTQIRFPEVAMAPPPNLVPGVPPPQGAPPPLGGPPPHSAPPPPNVPMPFATRMPSAPPPGFVREGAAPLDGDGGMQVVYSDGLECVSLFQFSGSQPLQMQGAARGEIAGVSVMSRSTSHGNFVSWSDGDRSYAMMSSLPEEAVSPVVSDLSPSEKTERKGFLYYLKRGWSRLTSFFG